MIRPVNAVSRASMTAIGNETRMPALSLCGKEKPTHKAATMESGIMTAPATSRQMEAREVVRGCAGRTAAALKLGAASAVGLRMTRLLMAC